MLGRRGGGGEGAVKFEDADADMESGVAVHGSAEAVELDEQLRRHSRGGAMNPSPERGGGGGGGGVDEVEGYETAEEGDRDGNKRRSGVSARVGQQFRKRFSSKRDSRSSAKMETVEVVEIDEKGKEQLQERSQGQQQGQSRGSVGKAL